MSRAANTTNFRQSLGRMGEALARDHLRKQDWHIVESNYFAHRLGEIDIIAQPPGEKVVVFIEVKTRDIKAQENGLDHPGQMAVHYRKRKSLIATAMTYLRSHPTGCGLRFDLILVDVKEAAQRKELVMAKDLEGLKALSTIVHLTNVVGAF